MLPWKTLTVSESVNSYFHCIPIMFQISKPLHFVSWKVQNLSIMASWQMKWRRTKQTNTCHDGSKSGISWHISHSRKSTADVVHRQALLHRAPSLTLPLCSPLIFCLLWSSTYRPRPYQKSQPDEDFKGEGRYRERWRKAKSVSSYCWNNPITMPIKLSFTVYSF